MADAGTRTKKHPFPLANAVESLDFAIETFRAMVEEAGALGDAAAILTLAGRARRHVIEVAECHLRPSTYALLSFEASFRGAGAEFKGRLKVSTSSSVREWEILRALNVLEDAFIMLRLASLETCETHALAWA